MSVLQDGIHKEQRRKKQRALQLAKNDRASGLFGGDLLLAPVPGRSDAPTKSAIDSESLQNLGPTGLMRVSRSTHQFRSKEPNLNAA